MPGIILDVRTPPVAVRSGGGYLIQYELVVTNASTRPLTIQRVEVLAPAPLVVLEGESLAKAFASSMTTKAVVPSSQPTAILLALSADHAPASLTHRIRFQVGDDPDSLTVEYPGTPVRVNTLRIHPPLSGDKWVAVNSPSGNNHHTASFLPF